jgi:two-component system, NtrC family, response regulator AtoC
VTFASGDRVRLENLPARIRKYRPEGDGRKDDVRGLTVEQDKLPPLAEVERRYIRHVLSEVGGNKRRAANILGIGRRTLYRRLGENMD